MAMAGSDMMPLSEALEEVIRRTGWSRRKAKRWLVRHLANGDVRSRARVIKNGMSLGEQNIPPEFWHGATEVGED